MHNLSYLIGRLENDLQKEDGKVIVNLIVTRQFKNENGEYENDIIPIILFTEFT